MLIQELEKVFFCFCIYKMCLISAEGYENARVQSLRVKKTDKIWASMKNLQDGSGAEIMSDLILKEIYGKYETKNLTKEQIKKHEMTERYESMII